MTEEDEMARETRRGGRHRGDRRSREERPRWFGFGPVNLAVFAAALVAIVAGYVLLDRGSVTAAPMLLTLGYVVLIPAGLIIGYGREE